MLLLKELHHDNIVSLLGAGYLPDGRRFVALVSICICRLWWRRVFSLVLRVPLRAFFVSVTLRLRSVLCPSASCYCCRLR